MRKYLIAHAGDAQELEAVEIQVREGNLAGLDAEGRALFVFPAGFWTSCIARPAAA